MIEVELPDGTIAEFPDGTSQDVMRDALRRRFGGQPESDVSRETRAKLSEYTQNPAVGQYENMSMVGQIGQAADDIMRLTAGGASYGFADKVAAGGDPEQLKIERARTQAARDRAGSAGMAAELLGSVMTPVGLAGKGATLAGRFGTGSMEGIKGLLARTGLMGVEGAGYGAASALGNDQDIGTGAAMGLLAGMGGNVLGEGISKGVSKVAGAFNKKPPRITVDELKAAGNKAYTAAENAGIIVTPQGMQTLNKRIVDDFTDFAFLPANEPGAAVVLAEIQKQANRPVTLKGLDTLRKMAGNAYIPGNKSNNALISKVVSRIDELIGSGDPNLLAGANTQAGAAALKEARSNWSKARKLETVEGFAKKGEAIGNSQINQDVEGATRRQIRQLLTNEAKARGFTPAELDAAKKAASMTPGMRALRAGQGMLPTGKLGGMIHGTAGLFNAASGNLPGLALQGAGMLGGLAARKGEEALSRKAVEKFTDLVARGGVPAPTTKNAVQRLAESKEDALIRFLMSSGILTGSKVAQ